MSPGELLDYFDVTFGFNQDIYNLTDNDEQRRYKTSFYKIRMRMKKKDSE